MAFGKFVDMALTPKEQGKDAPTIAYPPDSAQPTYPWGLSGCLADDQLEKLGLELPEVGDLLDARIMMKITSVSQNETTEGKRSRVEYQIIMMAVEDEDEEDMPSPPRRKFRPLTYKT